MFHFQFTYPLQFKPFSFKKKLTSLGFANFYEIEEGRKKILGCFHTCPKPNLGDLTPFLCLQERAIVDWESQWQLANHTLTIKNHSWIIKPGEGFGDFSHPTTRMMADALETYCQKGSFFIDIGCGSGILSLLALQAGAARVIAVDVCEKALSHAKKTFTDNDVLHLITLHSPPLPLLMPDNPPLLGINMTFGEQKEALFHYLYLLEKGASLISSGILEKQAAEYCTWIYHITGYMPKLLYQIDGWTCWHIAR